MILKILLQPFRATYSLLKEHGEDKDLKAFASRIYDSIALYCITLVFPFMWIILKVFDMIVAGYLANPFRIFSIFYWEITIWNYPIYRWHLGVYFLVLVCCLIRDKNE